MSRWMAKLLSCSSPAILRSGVQSRHRTDECWRSLKRSQKRLADREFLIAHPKLPIGWTSGKRVSTELQNVASRALLDKDLHGGRCMTSRPGYSKIVDSN